MRLYLKLCISILGIFVNLSQSSSNMCSSDEGGNKDTIKIQPELQSTKATIECGIDHAYNISWYRFNETIETSSIYKPPCNNRGNPRLLDEGQKLVIDYVKHCHTAIYTCVANDSDVVTHSTDLRVVDSHVHKPILSNDSDSLAPSIAIAEDVVLTYKFDEGQGSEEEGVMFQWRVQAEHCLVFLSNDTSLPNFTTSSFHISQKQWLVDRRRFASTTLHIKNVDSAAVTNYTLLACNEYGDDSFIITLQLTPIDHGLLKTILISLSFLVLLSLTLFTVVYKFRVDIQLYLINLQTNDEDSERDPDEEGLQKWDVFISHSGPDTNDWQFVFQTLRGQLEKKGYTVCLDERDFIPGTNMQEEYVRHISRSLRTIIVISSDYLKSKHCNFQISAALDMFKEHKTKIISLIYNDISSKDIHKFHPKLASVLRVLPVVRWTDGSNNVEDICKRLYAFLPRPSRLTKDGDKPIALQI